jgi:competence protein ComGC
MTIKGFLLCGVLLVLSVVAVVLWLVVVPVVAGMAHVERLVLS